MRRISATFIAIAVFITCTNPAQANEEITLRQAIQAYGQENYSSAYEQMLDYLPLGSADAAHYLGFLSIDGHGTEYDPVAAMAYFQAAKEWGHAGSAEYIAQIEPHLSAEELAAVAQQVAQLQNQLIVPHSDARFEANEFEQPERLRAVNPRYPDSKLRQGQMPWMNIAQVIGPNGKIIHATRMSSTTNDVFAAYRRVQGRWRYAESERISVRFLHMAFFIYMSTKEEQDTYEKAFNKVYPLAVAGLPEHQMYLADLVRQTDQNGEFFDFMEGIKRIPFLERSARGGYIHAQRIMALHYRRTVWAEYLISKGDLTTATLYGAILYSHAADPEQAQRGAELIRTAAAAGYENAQALLEFL
ncbi:MAG: hypothetical protein LAT53_04265 [Idiomarina sp.]|nr:hypothetical protein [Idiomarina sp.]